MDGPARQHSSLQSVRTAAYKIGRGKRMISGGVATREPCTQRLPQGNLDNVEGNLQWKRRDHTPSVETSGAPSAATGLSLVY